MITQEKFEAMQKLCPDTLHHIVQDIHNYSDGHIEEMRTEVFNLMRVKIPNFHGGQFCFIGDVASFTACFIVQEAQIIGSKKTPKQWLVSRKYDTWKVQKLAS